MCCSWHKDESYAMEMVTVNAHDAALVLVPNDATLRLSSGAVAVALFTIPIAIASNGLRVAGTGIAAHYWGPQAAEGFFHTFSGWLMFVVAFCMLFVVTQLIIRIVPRPSRGVLPESIIAVRS